MFDDIVVKIIDVDCKYYKVFIGIGGKYWYMSMFFEKCLLMVIGVNLWDIVVKVGGFDDCCEFVCVI